MIKQSLFIIFLIKFLSCAVVPPPDNDENKDVLVDLSVNTSKSGVTNYGRTCVYGKKYPFCDRCGVQPVRPNVKIVGGKEAVKNSWPSIAYLSITENGDTFGCGGTLIDRETVLTAAHCFSNNSKVSVYLGLHDVRDIENESGNDYTMREPRKLIIHENYNTKTKENDIALIKLSKPVSLSPKIQPACLPPGSNYKPNSNIRALIAGWGRLSSEGKTPDTLQNTFITYFFSGRECSNYDNLNFNKQICAGDIEGRRDACQGDSGGPLYLREKEAFIVAGVTSYGIGCADKENPGIYIRVAAYLDWISKNI